MAPAKTRQTAPGAAELIEESVHLLRQHPQELASYYAATGPFALGLLYFWSYVTWFAPGDGEVAAGALLLALTFGVMKAGQNRFALRMLGRRLGEMPARWSAGDWMMETMSQFRLQATGIVLVPLAAVFGVPFGWVYGYYQNAAVLPRVEEGEPAKRHEQAWALILLWPAQNHWMLLILSGLWLMVFLNLAVAFYLVPSLANQWLGLRTGFALDGWSMFNTTFLALVAVLTHLLVDPLIKTCFVLRVFHGQARYTGADLRLVLQRARLRRRLAMGLAVLVLGGVLCSVPNLPAAEPAPVAPAPQAAPARLLDPALDRVLEQPEFRWRLRPLPVPPDRKNEGIIKGFVRSTLEVLKQIISTVSRWVEKAYRWAADLLPGSKAGPDKDAAESGMANPLNWASILHWVAYVLLLVVAGLLLFVAWKVWRHNLGSTALAAPAPLPAGTPDLRDENVEASRLPSEGWLDLARQQMAAGEWRLALRALFLATLARHARAGLLSLAKFKTNLDYEAELGRRARSRTTLVQEFRGQRREFEEVWYGSAPASDSQVRGWLQRMEASP